MGQYSRSGTLENEKNNLTDLNYFYFLNFINVIF